jgi:hypothetical protein
MTQQRNSADQWRVEFDAEVEFSNGGALQVQGFRLDIPGTDIDDDELGELLVGHLGLLMVGQTVIKNRSLIREPHKGSRGVAVAAGTRTVVDLTGPDTLLYLPDGERLSPLAGLVDLPGVLIRLTGSTLATVDRPALAPYRVGGHAVVLHTGGGARLTAGAATWLAEQGVALVAADGTTLADVTGLLAGRGVPTVTAVAGLDDLPPTGFRLHAVPTGDRPTDRPVRIYGVRDGG